MENKSLLEHKFYTYKQLLDHLQEKGLIVIENWKLLWYLKSFNYQNVINEYNKPFLANYQRFQYLKNANSQMIIDLFNFNRTLSRILIGDLHTIEMQLSSSIAYKLTEIISGFHANRSSLCALTVEEKATIFDYQNEKQINRLFTELQNNFMIIGKNNDENGSAKEYIDKTWKQWDEVPMYSLPLLWTFGISINFFCNLNHDIQKQIIQEYFNRLGIIDVKTFECLLYCLKDLRNKISHNEVIYKFQFESVNLINRVIQFNTSSRKNKIKKLLENDFLRLSIFDKDTGIDLKFVKILEVIVKITDNHDLKRVLNQHLELLKNSIKNGCHKGTSKSIKYKPCEEAWNNICAFLGCGKDEF